MQNKTRLELADYEAENLAKLQKMFSRKWEFIFMQAEGIDINCAIQWTECQDLTLSFLIPAQSKVDKKRDKLERKVLDSQERAFWDVFRPMPNCINTTEVDIKKAYRKGGSSLGSGSGSTRIHHNYSVEQLTRHVRFFFVCLWLSMTKIFLWTFQVQMLKLKLERRTIKISKVAES